MAIIRGNKNRGKAQQGRPQQAQGGNSQPHLANYFEGALQPSQFPSVIKELIHVGKDPTDLLMRTYLLNDRQASQVALLFLQFDECDMPDRFYECVHRKLALNCSIRGRGRNDVLQASAGVVVEDYVTDGMYPKNGKQKKRKHDEDDDE